MYDESNDGKRELPRNVSAQRFQLPMCQCVNMQKIEDLPAKDGQEAFAVSLLPWVLSEFAAGVVLIQAGDMSTKRVTMSSRLTGSLEHSASPLIDEMVSSVRGGSGVENGA